jgi:hypothetical protein
MNFTFPGFNLGNKTIRHPSANRGWQVTNYTVDTGAVLISGVPHVTSPYPLTERCLVILQNNGTTVITIGTSSSIVAGAGLEIASGGSLELPIGPDIGEVYAISTASGTLSVVEFA